jgi:hypothetical protein
MILIDSSGIGELASQSLGHSAELGEDRARVNGDTGLFHHLG